MPDDITKLDFSLLTNTHCFVLGEYMSIRNRIMALPNVVARRALLRERCMQDAMSTARAQEGYETIVLGKQAAPKDAVDPGVERRTYEIISTLIRDNESKWSKRAQEGCDIIVTGVKKEMRDFAKKALLEASENFRPLAIVEQGKKPRKMKGVLPPEFERMVQLGSQRKPIMLVGPAGCGKTYLAEKLAEALGMEYSDQSCSEGMSESVFNGLLLPIGANGEFKHVQSPFMERYETGGVMLLDEIDAGDPNLFTYINKAIANSSYTVAQRWKKSRIEKHGDFVLVAAANTYGNGADTMYVGRNQLDAATLDRFKVGLITMDYSREVEKSLAPDSICEWAWKIRENIRKHKLRRIMSTRTIRDVADMTEAYKWDEEQWNDTYFASWPGNEKALALGVA
jgi:hypothetical protein